MGNTIGIISGYFNPLHVGHIEYINRSSEICDILMVIVNNDIQVELKGSTPFMTQEDRHIILNNIQGVDVVSISLSEDGSVCKDIEWFCDNDTDNEYLFINSGDRNGDNIPESDICNKLGVKIVSLGQPKIESSSNLLRRL